MNRLSTQVIKARQVEVSYVIDERDTEAIANLDRLRKEGVRDFKGQRIDLKLTDFLTVHSVIAVEEIRFDSAKHKQQHYLSGNSSPLQSTVTVKLILDAAKVAQPVEEKLIGNDVLELPSGSVRELK